MAKQTINPGTAPTGAGGDTFRSGSAKLQANDDELYNYLGDGVNLNKLGTAAFKNTGTQAGNVMEVGAFGLGNKMISETPDSTPIQDIETGFFRYKTNSVHKPAKLLSYDTYGIKINSLGDFSGASLWLPYFFGGKDICLRVNDYGSYKDFYFYTDRNTTIDGNGFIKAASPIVKLFADKIELNDEAAQQKITFEKLGVGDYLIKGSSGFAQEGWYVETPKDANGNLLVAVVYEQLENGDISVKTYDYMLNKKGRIVADTETPLDIPETRWIDLRLQELPQPEIEMPESITPPDFQPTGLDQAVATVMESYHDTEQ
mgnify:CR=1 FL=1